MHLLCIKYTYIHVTLNIIRFVMFLKLCIYISYIIWTLFSFCCVGISTHMVKYEGGSISIWSRLCVNGIEGVTHHQRKCAFSALSRDFRGQATEGESFNNTYSQNSYQWCEGCLFGFANLLIRNTWEMYRWFWNGVCQRPLKSWGNEVALLREMSQNWTLTLCLNVWQVLFRWTSRAVTWLNSSRWFKFSFIGLIKKLKSQISSYIASYWWTHPFFYPDV